MLQVRLVKPYRVQERRLRDLYGGMVPVSVAFGESRMRHDLATAKERVAPGTQFFTLQSFAVVPPKSFILTGGARRVGLGVGRFFRQRVLDSLLSGDACSPLAVFNRLMDCVRGKNWI